MRFFRRQEIPWEVVASRAIDTTPTYCEEELEDGKSRFTMLSARHPLPTPHSFSDLDIVAVSEVNTSQKYVFDIKSMSNTSAVSNAVVFARQQLLQQASKYGYNIFLQERYCRLFSNLVPEPSPF